MPNSTNRDTALTDYLCRQRVWSKETFGPGKRTGGICEHIRKELLEIQADPTDVVEWIDVMILAMDGYWRAGGDPAHLMGALRVKQMKNFARTWPPPGPEDEASEHIRG